MLTAFAFVDGAAGADYVGVEDCVWFGVGGGVG